MKTKESFIRHQIGEIVWINRWSRNGEGMRAVLTPEEYIEIEEKLFRFIEKTVENELQQVQQND